MQYVQTATRREMECRMLYAVLVTRSSRESAVWTYARFTFYLETFTQPTHPPVANYPTENDLFLACIPHHDSFIYDILLEGWALSYEYFFILLQPF